MTQNENISSPKEVQTAVQAPALSRRAMLQRTGLMAGAAVVSAAVPALLSRASAQDTMMNGKMMDDMMLSSTPTATNPFGSLANLATDLDIFNFALILEYLEAEFYARVVAANNRRTFLQPRVGEIAQKLANDEAAHVVAITNRIVKMGGTPAAKPTFQFPENVFISQFGFLELAAAFEVTGVGAYSGAAPKIRANDNLRFAASIYGIEARHTALIRMLDGRTFAPDALEMPLTAAEVASRVAPFILL